VIERHRDVAVGPNELNEPPDTGSGRRRGPATRVLSINPSALAVKLMPTIEDDVTADLIECFVLVLEEREADLRAVRMVLSATLTITHTQDLEMVRLRRRLADLFAESRRERSAT
jgi:hypothetical protein